MAYPLALSDRGPRDRSHQDSDVGVVPKARLLLASARILRAAPAAAQGAGDYDNHVYAVNTGVTKAVKCSTITGSGGGRREAIVQLPHVRPIDGRHPIRQSTRA